MIVMHRCVLHGIQGELTFAASGLSTPRAHSQPPLANGTHQRSSSQQPSKSVQFNLDSPTSSRPSSPEHIRERRQRSRDRHDRTNNHGDGIDSEHSASFSDDPSISHSASSSSRPHRRRHHHPRHDHDPHHPVVPSNSSANTLVNSASARSPSPAQSDATEDLPQRFDNKGRRIPEKGEDPLADKVEQLLSGGGGGSLGKFMKGFLGGEDDPLGDGGKRSRRRQRD